LLQLNSHPGNILRHAHRGGSGGLLFFLGQIHQAFGRALNRGIPVYGAAVLAEARLGKEQGIRVAKVRTHKIADLVKTLVHENALMGQRMYSTFRYRDD
jgi:hypothetical protein